jgi:NADH-quinone oxidoreductase subunit L
MNATSVLTLSLVILFLPLLGFIAQLLVGRMRTPLDYVADPHENPAHDGGPHGNPADAATADHAQRGHDDPVTTAAGIVIDEHRGDVDRHREYLVTRRRGHWTDADQRRAWRLSWISTAIMGLCLALSLWVAYLTLTTPPPEGKPAYYPKYQASALWFDFADAPLPAGGSTRPGTFTSPGPSVLPAASGAERHTIALGILADNISAIMLVVVTLISLLVHLFSSEYMREPSMHGGRLNRYYAFLGLFTFSMLGIVIADNLLMLYIFWELVGLSSYLLIGYWYERPAPGYASMKAFITNRIGDIGMFAGIMILYTQLGTFQLTAIFDAIAAGHIPFGSNGWLTAAGLLLFCGAVGKSAQFPLNVWLPDAMEGPTPVSALIHAATMVAAGVYLMARIFPLLTGDALLTIAAVGAVTAFVAATIALVQWDLKKVLAFSTVSQLGFMMMALGAGAYRAAIFHLVTHAMFKACLFLGSGSVIHRMHGALHELGDHDSDPQDMRNMGGLRARMPVTYITMLVATLAVSGVPLFSGYMSKDAILEGIGLFATLVPHFIATAVWIISYLVVGLTAFYMFRMIFLTFHGTPGSPDIHARIVESRRVMLAPLAVLALLSLWIPFGANPFNPGSGWFLGSWISMPGIVVPPTATFRPQGQIIDLPRFSVAVPLVITGLGILVAFLLYGTTSARGRALSWAPPRGVRALLFNRWYQDNIYERIFPLGFTVVLMKALAWLDQNVIDGFVNGVGSFAVGLSRLADGFDTYVVDGLVNLVAGMTQFLGLVFRQLQSGRVQTYVLYVVLGVVVLFFLFI